MWIKHLFLGFIGLASGVGVAAGTFAFIIVIGVVPRMIAKCNRAESTILFENMIVLGGIFGTIMSVFTYQPSGRALALVCIWFLCRYFCGMYCSGTGRNLKYVPDHLQKIPDKRRTFLDHAVYGIWKMCRSVLVFWTSHDTALMQKGQSGENIFTGICQKDSTETLLYGQHGI